MNSLEKKKIRQLIFYFMHDITSGNKLEISVKNGRADPTYGNKQYLHRKAG